MKEHIPTILASLHARLTLLEHQIHLAGRDTNDIEYKTESLRNLKQAALQICFQIQMQGLPAPFTFLHDPVIPTSGSMVKLFGPIDPLVYVPTDVTSPESKY